MESISAKTSSCCCSVCDKEADMCPNVWSRLPDELIIELLRPLPKEVLLGFRLVSKEYNFAISRCFLPKLAASAPVSGFVFQWEKTIYPEREKRRIVTYSMVYPPPPYNCYYGYVTESGSDFAARGGKLVESYLSLLPFVPKTDDFLGCFNGFFLVRNTSSVPIQYYVCNPATKQRVAIPTNPSHLEVDSFAGLAFDPLDPPPHNFKIVRIPCSSSSLNHEMDVFSSATGEWVNHRIPLEPEILEFEWNRRSIYFHGVFYILSTSKYLLCFDLDENALKARVVKLPPRKRDDCVGLFEASNDCLYYACKVDNDLLVWTFQTSNEEASSPWTLKYNITVSFSQSSLSLIDRSLRRYTSIFAVDLSANIIYMGSKDGAFKYDIKRQKYDYHGAICYGYLLYDRSFCFYPYSCSLVRLSEQFSPS